MSAPRTSPPARRQNSDAPRVSYRVAAKAPAAHRFEVEVRVEGAPGSAAVLVLPVWTPGSYMVRDFSRHLVGGTAKDLRGRRLPVEKIRKNAWRVVHDGATFTFGCEAFAFEPTVRTAYLDAERGWFNAANLLPYLEGATGVPHEVALELPRGWSADTTLPRAPGGRRRYRAADYDALCDHPFVFGQLRVRRFRAAGRPHRFTLNGAGALPERAVDDAAACVAEAAKLFGGLPYRDYAFLVNYGTDAEGMGGLEHRDSCLLHVPARATLDAAKYRAFVGLVAHEHFHLWNVKRIRAAVLGPFDYERETYVDLLWFHEGFTAYYDDLLPTRAGVFKADEYLAILAETLTGYYATPGRRVQPLAEASFDAWIKFYKRNEETRSTTVSYYAHGALVALAWDLRLRAETRGRRSLDDVLRALWADARRGGTLDAQRWLAIAREATGVDLTPLYRRHVAGTVEPDFAEALATVGLRTEIARPDDAEKPWLGLATRVEGGRVVVDEALHGGPGLAAGLSAKDELVAIDGRRVGADLDLALRGAKPSDMIAVDVFRNDRLVRLRARVGRNPAPALKIVPLPRVSAAARRRFTAWCGRPWPFTRR